MNYASGSLVLEHRHFYAAFTLTADGAAHPPSRPNDFTLCLYRPDDFYPQFSEPVECRPPPHRPRSRPRPRNAVLTSAGPEHVTLCAFSRYWLQLVTYHLRRAGRDLLRLDYVIGRSIHTSGGHSTAPPRSSPPKVGHARSMPAAALYVQSASVGHSGTR